MTTAQADPYQSGSQLPLMLMVAGAFMGLAAAGAWRYATVAAGKVGDQ
jgi:hypothetical protein